MKILFDHNIPVGLKDCLAGHDVHRAFERGWSRLTNGELIATAEANHFEIMVTADQGIFYQQNNLHRTISLVVLNTNEWNIIFAASGLILEAITRSGVGSYELLKIKPAR